MTSLRKLVITADDFGYGAERDSGILECYQNGAITRASLIVNSVNVKSAVIQAAKAGLPLGLHLNLTEGLPVCDENEVPSLLKVNAQIGRKVFLGKFGFRKALARDEITMDQVKLEIQCQIQKFINLVGQAPQFADGHQHFHVVKGVSEQFAAVLGEFGIKETRLPEEDLGACDWIEQPRLSFYNDVIREAKSARDVFKMYNIRASDCYIGMSIMGADMTLPRLKHLLTKAFCAAEKKAPAGTNEVQCELMTHPGYPCTTDGGCGEGPDNFAQSDERQHEMNILSQPELFEFYKESSIYLS